MLRPTTVEEEKFSEEGMWKMRKGGKREREKDKETRGNREKGEKKKGGKCSLLPQWRRKKVLRKSRGGPVASKLFTWVVLLKKFCGTPLR